MAAPVARQERDLASRQLAQHERIRRLAERRLHALFMNVGESGHGIQPAAPDDADLCLSQIALPRVFANSPVYKAREAHRAKQNRRANSKSARRLF